MIAHHLEHITVQRLRVAEHACMRQVNATGPGYVTYKLAPAQPLATGTYTVAAKYTPIASYASASSSNPYAFTVNPAATPPPPTSESVYQQHQASSGA